MTQLGLFGNAIRLRKRTRAVAQRHRTAFVKFMSDGRWRTLNEISVLCRIPIRRVLRYIDDLRGSTSVRIYRRLYRTNLWEFRLQVATGVSKGGR